MNLVHKVKRGIDSEKNFRSSVGEGSEPSPT